MIKEIQKSIHDVDLMSKEMSRQYREMQAWPHHASAIGWVMNYGELYVNYAIINLMIFELWLSNS